MAFLAAMQARTPSLRNHHMTFWKEVLEAGEHIERRMKTATGEEKKRAAVLNPPRSEGDSMTMEDVRRVISSPMEHTLVPHITAQLPFLADALSGSVCGKRAGIYNIRRAGSVVRSRVAPEASAIPFAKPFRAAPRNQFANIAPPNARDNPSARSAA
jgi:hypothetical protein